MNWKKFGSELIRRNVVRAIVAYLAVAWVIVQIASIIFPAFDAPPYLMKGLIYLLAVGLVFWIGFSWVYDLTPGGIQKTESEAPDPEVHEANSRNLNRVIVGGILTAVMLLLIASFWAGSQWGNGTAGEQAKVAVIPLKMDSSVPNEADEDYFSGGLTDDLIDELSKLDNLTVLSLATTQYLEAGLIPENEPLAQKMEEVEYFIFGEIARSSNRIEIALHASRDLDSEPFWEQTYQEDLSRIRVLWAEVASDLSEVIGDKENPLDRSKWKDLRPVQPETYELYLKGKYYLNRSTVEDWQRGLVYLQEAIDQNPADPYAYAGMAEGYITWGHSVMPPPDVFPKAEAAAKRAIQLDSSNAQGWAALSQFHTYFGWDWELADYAFQRANRLNPNLAMNHYHRAWYLTLFGKMDEAIAEHIKAQEIDPFSSLHTAWLGSLYAMVGEYDKALEQVRKASEMFDDNALSMTIKGDIYLRMGRIEEGIAELREAARINSGHKWFSLGPALLENGYKAEGQAILMELIELPQSSYFSLSLARMYYALQDYEKVFEHLEGARGHAFYPWMVRLGFKKLGVHDGQRYADVLNEMRLPPPAPLEYQGKLIDDGLVHVH